MADQDVPIGYLLRTVRTVVWTTALVLGALAVSLALPGGRRDVRSLTALVGAAALLTAGAAALPWHRILRRTLGRWVFYGWTGSYIALVSAAVAVDGGGRSSLVFLYALSVVFAAMVYRPAAQAVFAGLTVVSYMVALASAGWETMSPARTFTNVAGLGALWLFGSFLSREVAANIDDASKTRRESERRAELLAIVARAARSVSALESGQVLEAVVQGATTLGLESANLALFDEIEGTYSVAHGIGLPADYVEAEHSATAGMPGLVRRQRETVVVDDYANHPNAVPTLRSQGFRAAIATPVWVHGRLTAALVGGTRERREITAEETEAFELLAALAGRALENVRAFEDERRTVERMAELDRMKGDFLSNVSHELRTPLTAISGMGMTLEHQWEAIDEDVRRELLSRLNANARTLDRIIGNLLDYSRLEAGRMELHMEGVPVDDLLEQVVGRLRTLFGTHPLSVEAQPGLAVNGDPLLLDRVVENLLSNAVKHTPPGTAVTLKARREAGQILVLVADDGPGIPPEEQRHLGDRFFRGRDPTARRTRGTGLGLALVREILRLHGADLEVDSALGRGTSFGFRLQPAVEASERSTSGASSV